MSRFMEEEEISEYRDCFNLYDKSRTGKLPCKDAVFVMRSLGVTPTVMEVQKGLTKIGKELTDTIDFSQFLELMYSHKSTDEPKVEILKAFEVMDTAKTGTVNSNDLRRFLMNCGERFSSKEVDKMFRAARVVPNQQIKYKDFVRVITIPVPNY